MEPQQSNGEARTGVAVVSQRLTDCQERGRAWRLWCEQELDKVNKREDEVARDIHTIKTEQAVGRVKLDAESKRFVALIMVGGTMIAAALSLLGNYLLR